MAVSVRQFVLDMIEEASSQKTEDVINRGELPDKPTHEFSMEELKLILENTPTGIMELFDRSGWEIDDAGRRTIVTHLKEKVFDDVDTPIKAKEAYEQMSEIQREILIRFKAIIYSTVGFSLFEGLHIRAEGNPVKAPKFVEDHDYETLVMCIVNPTEEIGMVMNTVNKMRIITSMDRAIRYYTDGFINECKNDGITIMEYKTEIAGDESKNEKLMVRMIGHRFQPGERVAVSGDSIMSDAARDAVKDRLRSKILKKFRQEDGIPDENEDNNDDNNNNTPPGFSSNLKFPEW